MKGEQKRGVDTRHLGVDQVSLTSVSRELDIPVRRIVRCKGERGEEEERGDLPHGGRDPGRTTLTGRAPCGLYISAGLINLCGEQKGRKVSSAVTNLFEVCNTHCHHHVIPDNQAPARPARPPRLSYLPCLQTDSRLLCSISPTLDEICCFVESPLIEPRRFSIDLTEPAPETTSASPLLDQPFVSAASLAYGAKLEA